MSPVLHPHTAISPDGSSRDKIRFFSEEASLDESSNDMSDIVYQSLYESMQADIEQIAELNDADLMVISDESNTSLKVDSNLSRESNTEIQFSTKSSQLFKENKPSLSYIALISKAIQSSPCQRMLLADIYNWIAEKYPYFKKEDRSWRNSVRHNLSLNECFIKCGRSEAGKGSYWTIHPACSTGFAKGDFRRRHARRRARQNDEFVFDQEPTNNTSSMNIDQIFPSGYVHMTSNYLSNDQLVEMFGIENVLTNYEQKEYLSKKMNSTPQNEYYQFVSSCRYQNGNH